MSARSKFHSLLQAANFGDAIRQEIVAEILGEHAHELAEEIRSRGIETWDGMNESVHWLRQGRIEAANLIDPEVA